MTGIFQIFDRYKAKAYGRNDPRKFKNGETETKPVPAYYVIEEDGVPRRVSTDVADQRQAQSEASRDSRRSSSVDTSEVLDKSLSSLKEIQPDTLPKHLSARPSTESQNPGLAFRAQDESWSPQKTPKESKRSKERNDLQLNMLSEADTPRSVVPSRGSVDSRGGLKLPPRDTRMPRASAHKDRLRTFVENDRDAPLPFDDTRDFSRALIQLKEAAQLPVDTKEGHRRSSVVTRKDGQRYQSSGDERDVEKYRKDGRRYQSSGDEREGDRYHLPGEIRDARRYSSATDNYRQQAYDDEKDDYRAQYPSEGKEIRLSRNPSGGRRTQALAFVKETHRHHSSGDEMDGQRYESSGDEKGGHRPHPSSERRDGHRHRVSVDRESHKKYMPVHKDGQRHQPCGDLYDGTRFESSGDERGSHRPYSSGERREPRRHHHRSSGDERGDHRYYTAEERDKGRRHHSGREGQRYQSSGDERRGHRYHTSPRDVIRKHSSGDYVGRKHPPSAESNDRHKFQSSGDERGVSKYRSSSAKGPKHVSGAIGYEGRHYQSSGDERGGHRFYLSGGDRESGKRHDISAGSNDNWRKEIFDEDREASTKQSRNDAREDGRRYSSATEGHRRHRLHEDEGYTYQAPGDNMERGKKRSTGREGQRYERVSDPREFHRQYLITDTKDGQSDGVSDDAHEGSEIQTSPAVKDGHRRNPSLDSRGGHRRQSSKLPKEVVLPHLAVETCTSKSKERERHTGHSRDLPPRSAAIRNIVSPRNLLEIRDLARLNVQGREGFQSASPKDNHRGEPQKPSNLQISAESNEISKLHHDFREMMRAIDFRDSQWSSEKGRDGTRISSDGRDLPRTSNVSRISVDSRQYQSTTPRLSVEGREHLRASSLHSSRASSVDSQAQLRTNSMDSSGSGEFKRRGPSVVARLMGLAELPESDTTLPSLDKHAVREGKSLQKLLSSTPPAESQSPSSDRAKVQLHLSEVALQMKQVAARLHQDPQMRLNLNVQQDAKPKRKSKAKSSSSSRSRSPPPAPAQLDGDAFGSKQDQGPATLVRQLEAGSLHPLPKQPMSPKHHQMEGMPSAFKKRPELPPGDVDQRLHQLRIKNSIQEHKTLKQILEAMHLKGLLHPPPKKHSKSLKAESHEMGLLREVAQRPLHVSDSKASSSTSAAVRSHHIDAQEVLRSQDSPRKNKSVQEEPTPESDHAGEASIVVMKPVNHQFVNPLAATKDLENQPHLSSHDLTLGATFPGVGEENPSENISRGRSSERRGRVSRSHSMERHEQFAADKAPPDDLSFANVMLSWRERIASDAAKKAAMELAEAKLPVRPKGSSGSSSGSKQRSRDSSPSRSSRSGSERNIEKLKNLEKLEFENLGEGLKDRESQAALRTLQSEIPQTRASNDEVTFKAVGRSKSDRHLAAPSAETLVSLEPSFGRSNSERVPAQVAVLRSKRTAGKASRLKDKVMTSPSGDLELKFPSPLPETCNIEGDPSTDQFSDSCHDLDDTSKRDMVTPGALVDTIAVAEKALVDVSRVTSKKRRIEEIAVVNEEDHQVPMVVNTGLEVPVFSEGTADDESGGDSPDASVSVVDSLAGFSSEGQQDKEVDVDVKDGSGGNTIQDISVPKYQFVQEESGFMVLGADHPSPVSVLDSPIFQEGYHLEELSPSPKSVSTNRPEGADELNDHDEARELETEVLTPPHSEGTKDVSDPLRDIYTKVARSLELSDKELYHGHSAVSLPIPFVTDTTKKLEHAFEISSEFLDRERVYVKDILIESGLTDDSSLLNEDLPEIMQFDVFTRKEEELQTEELNRIDKGELDKSEEKRYKESLDRRLIFDCMNEILERKMNPYLNPQPWGTPVIRNKPSGQRLVDEVWDELQDMHWPATDAYDALYALLQKDFMRKGFQWLDFSIEVGEVGCELECMLFQDMVEEAVQDAMSTKLVRKSSPPQSPACSPTPPPSPSAASLFDESESRRRELLEKTRRDLLAWHVQYQQM